MTDTMPTRSEHAGSTDGAELPRQQFTTAVEAKADGQWLAVVHLGEGASVCKLFDNERDARHYGDELSQWLANRRSS